MNETEQSAGPGRRAGLTPDVVADAALALVEAGGPDALTMRKLAAELGVSTATIYWHVGTRDEVVTALIERLSQRQAAGPIAGTTGRERVMSLAREVWTSALAHPEVMLLAHQAGATSVLEHELERAMARELDAAGLRGAEARDALRAILICVGGFLVLGLRPDATVPPDRSSTALWAGVVDAAIDERTTAALATPVDLAALFERTLQFVVDSFVPA